MVKLRSRFGNWRQTLALCIVWGALAGSVALCYFAPASLRDWEAAGQFTGRAAAVMVALASRGF